MDHLYFSFVVLSCTFSSLSVWGHFVLSPYGKQQCDNSAKHLLLCSLDKRMSYKVGVLRSNIQYRYRSDTGIFCRTGVSVRRDWSKSDILCILFCVIVKPHESHKHIIKHHKVFVHYISSVLKPFHSLIWGTDEYLSQVDVNSSLRCVCLLSSIQRSNCVSRSVTRVKMIKLSARLLNVPNITLDL